MPKQIPYSPLFFQICISDWKHTAAEHVRNFLGIDFIRFCFSAMNCFHVEGMAQCKIYSAFGTEICNPIPGKDTFNSDYDVVSECVCYQLKVVGRTFHVFMKHSLSIMVYDADIHALIGKPLKKMHCIF